jgi:PPOX class probable F420-dependent enzyme
MALGDEKYLSFTTFKKSGDAVSTPVWVVTLDSGELAFWTSSGSGKAKRLAHTAKVTLQPSDARGKVKDGSAPSTGQARLIASDDPLFAQVQEKVKAKYGFMTHVTKALGTVGGIVKRNKIPYGDRAVVVAVD